MHQDVTPLDFEFIRRDLIISKPEYFAELDVYARPDGAQFLLGHIRVHTWTKTALRNLISEWKLFRSVVTAPIFACAETDDPKWAHFVSLLGFKPFKETICNNGERRRVFINLQKAPNEFVNTDTERH